MDWHTRTVETELLGALLTTIRSDNGTVISTRPDTAGCGVCVTWATPAPH